MLCRRIALVAAFSFLLPAIALAEQQTTPATGGERYLSDLLQAGGWAMFPLGLCLLATIYLVVYCARETASRRFFPAGCQPHSGNLADGDNSLRAATTAATAQPNSVTPTLFSRALRRGLSKAHSKNATDPRTAAEAAISETLAHAEAEHLRWIGYLNIIAAVAPMIGLLGTVSGMIGAFGVISLGGMGRPEMLAGDIGEALITTATGLCIAIPAMLCYHVLHNRLGLRMNETVSLLNDALDSHFPAAPAAVGTAPATAVTPTAAR